MGDVIIMKFGQNVQNKILYTYVQACLASCTILKVILEKSRRITTALGFAKLIKQSFYVCLGS